MLSRAVAGGEAVWLSALISLKAQDDWMTLVDQRF
jgi:hypothetical protein